MDLRNSVRKIPLIEIVAVLMLLLALVPSNPYSYYMLLRVVICGVCVYVAIKAHALGKTRWVWIFGGAALLYNPIIRAHLTRPVWSLINLATVMILVYSVIALRRAKVLEATQEQGNRD